MAKYIDTTRLSSWTFGGRRYAPGLHEVDDEETQNAAAAIGILRDDRKEYEDRLVREGNTTNDGYECEHCGANFRTVADVLNHRSVIHGLQEHTWPNYDLAAHREKEHGDLHFEREFDRAHEDSRMRSAASQPANAVHVDNADPSVDVQLIDSSGGGSVPNSSYDAVAQEKMPEKATPEPTSAPVPTTSGSSTTSSSSSFGDNSGEGNS